MKVEKLKDLSEDALYEMAVLRKEESNLPYDIWLDPSGSDRINKHKLPRIKVRVGDDLIPFLLDKDNPDIPSSVKKVPGKNYFRGFKYIKEYIKEYYDVLISHWEGSLSDREALNKLGKLGGKQIDTSVK